MSEENVEQNAPVESPTNSEAPEQSREEIRHQIWEDLKAELPEDKVEVDDEGFLTGETETAEEDQPVSPEGEDIPDEIEYMTFMAGDQEIKVPADAKITIQVDGEPVEVSLSEYQNELSGQKAIAQRFSALDRERKALEQNMAVWNDNQQAFQTKMDTGDVVGALDLVLENAGYNNEVVMQQFFQQIAGPLEAYMQLKPEDQALWAEQLRAERNRLQTDKLQEQNQMLQAERQQLQEIRRVQNQYSIGDQDFADLYHKLQDEMQRGQMTNQPITPDLVGQYHVMLGRETMAVEALKEVNPALAKDGEAVYDIVNAANYLARQGHEVTAEDVRDIVAEVHGARSTHQVQQGKQVSDSLRKKGQLPQGQIADSSAPANRRGKHFLEAISDDLAAAKTQRRKLK